MSENTIEAVAEIGDSWEESLALIAIKAEGQRYLGPSKYISPEHHKIIDGWAHIPFNLQTIVTLILAATGFAWWSAILWAWLPSTLAAFTLRKASSPAIGRFGHQLRTVAIATPLLTGIGAFFHSDWSLLALSVAGTLSIVGMLSPALYVVNMGRWEENPRYGYASRALGLRFPHQLAAEKLASDRPSGSDKR